MGKSVDNLVDVNEVEGISVSILEEGVFRISEREDINHFQNLLKRAELQKVSQEEAMEIFRMRSKPGLMAMSVHYETGEVPIGYSTILFEDGNLAFTEVTNGVGSSFYKIDQKSTELFQEVVAYSRDRIENRKNDVQVLKELEKEDGTRTFEVDLIEGKGDWDGE